MCFLPLSPNTSVTLLCVSYPCHQIQACFSPRPANAWQTAGPPKPPHPKNIIKTIIIFVILNDHHCHHEWSSLSSWFIIFVIMIHHHCHHHWSSFMIDRHCHHDHHCHHGHYHWDHHDHHCHHHWSSLSSWSSLIIMVIIIVSIVIIIIIMMIVIIITNKDHNHHHHRNTTRVWRSSGQPAHQGQPKASSHSHAPSITQQSNIRLYPIQTFSSFWSSSSSSTSIC